MNFQSYAYGQNHWLLDPDLKPVLSQYWPALPEHEAELESFGALAGGRAYAVADSVDRQARPALIAHDLDGRRIDRARLDPGHADLLRELACINRPPYEGGSWHHHFALGYLLADPGLYCSLIVTNQTAHIIHKYAREHSNWLEPLLSGEAWGATWMTETHGGSDLGANRTCARQSGGEWRLSGEDKYFASNAGLADLAVVTARIEGAPPGPKGISLFLTPRLEPGGELNFHVRRLKEKSATRAVPTGEIDFNNSLAYLVGEAGKGIYYTMENLTISRLANAAGAMGLARKAHLEALYRSAARRAFGRPLREHPLLRLDLTDLAVRTAAGLSLLFYSVELFQRCWLQTPPYSSGYHYARFFSHLVKNRTAEHAAEVTRLVMEVFGALGFLEEYAISRLHREALVTSIWEGTSNIQALDLLEAMQKKGAHESFLEDFIPRLERAGTAEARLAGEKIEQSLARLKEARNPSEAQWYAKDALRTLADCAQVALLYSLAENSGGAADRYSRLAGLYAARFLACEPYPAWALEQDDLWFPIAIEKDASPG